MKKIVSLILTASLIMSCVAAGDALRYGSGTFRSKWWNYYDRGLALSERSDPEGAIRDLQKAISMRSRDQRMARTYGMHFIDYFPHRELGIVYLNTGKTDKAISELERSLKDEESSKAIFYLNKARKTGLLEKGLRPDPPSISLYSPMHGAAVNSFKIKAEGRVSGKGYISRLSLNGEIYRIGLAEKEVEFEKEITVYDDTDRITVVSEDLLGNVSTHSIPLIVDREGPAISIFDIARENSGGKEAVRITGEVYDSTGIDRLTINNKNIATGGKITYEFNVIVESSTFVLQAYDKLDNVTKAEIDIEKELAAFYLQPAPVMLAFAGPDIFSSDDIPPVIDLKDSMEMPAVFVDKYYVEGEVSDNRKVEMIIVNGRNILSRKGKKGKNEIDIEAFDSSGNRSESDFTVTRTIPEALQVGSRMSISILPFDTNVQEDAAELLAYEHLIGSFVNQKRFNVIERAKLEQVLLEQKLTQEKLTDPEHSIKVGRLMASDTILATSVAVGSKSVEFTSRVINTETSRIMGVRDAYSEDRSAASIKQLMEGLASKVASSFPLVEGIVIKKEKKFVYTDLGTGAGIKGDMGIIVYRHGKEIRHPLTGKYLGRDMVSLANADIEEVHEDFSKAKLSDRPVPKNITVQDMVITR
jgi:hypothetical protein